MVMRRDTGTWTVDWLPKAPLRQNEMKQKQLRDYAFD
jgi:hypothetical protein